MILKIFKVIKIINYSAGSEDFYEIHFKNLRFSSFDSVAEAREFINNNSSRGTHTVNPARQLFVEGMV